MISKTIISILFLVIFMPVMAHAVDDNYLIGSGDVLKISVYDHQDLSTTARVNADGQIFFPLIGQVTVDNLTISAATAELAKQLADGYIINPQVSLFVEEFRSSKAVIMGQVSRPGLYEMSGRTTLLELLSKAGGATVDAGDRVTIKRKRSGKEQLITVDLRALLELGDLSQDIQILDGDSVFIAKAGMFYVTGEVNKPDTYKYEEGYTVIKAIAIAGAGGFSDLASKGRVKIIRVVDGKEVEIAKAPMNEPVFQGDVVVVPESIF